MIISIFGTMGTGTNDKRGIRVVYENLPDGIKALIKKERDEFEKETGRHLSLTRAVYRLLNKLT